MNDSTQAAKKVLLVFNFIQYLYANLGIWTELIGMDTGLAARIDIDMDNYIELQILADMDVI